MSVELQNQRAELLREALLKGWTRPADVQAPWTGQLAKERIERWYRRLYKAADQPLPVGQRLVNHFMLGADPEFVFHNGVQRQDARAFHLKAGPAFGADNNGRLCELRPTPNRSALGVLASMWLAMRWLVVYYPQTLGFSWRSGAYFEGDGLGGHIHFGRKRTKLRSREIAVLDRLAHLQFTAGIFDKEEGRMRVRHAQGVLHGQTQYGSLSDVRQQPHGYEYRTLPSWIDSPWLAYFNLVLSKLVVAFPDLVAPLTAQDAALSPEQARSQLRMLLAYYSAQDDDARLASAILARKGFPGHVQGLDFKANWGLFPAGPLGSKAEAEAPDIVPETVPPSAEDEVELAQAMFEGRAPELTSLKPTWLPHSLPKGYSQLIRHVDTKVAPGLGEFAMGLAIYDEHLVEFMNCGHGRFAFRFPMQVAEACKRTSLFGKLGVPADAPCDGWVVQVNASKDFTTEQLLYARDQIVQSGVLPLWNIAQVQADSYARWHDGRNSKQAKSPASSIVFEGERE